MTRPKTKTVPPPPRPLPTIPPEEQTPLVKVLLALLERYHTTDGQLRTIIDHQHALIGELEPRVRALEDEVRRLKNLPPRPNIKPSALNKDRDDDDPPAGGGATSNKRKRRRSGKRNKHLKIHHTTVIEPEHVPSGSRFRGYHDFYVQDLLIEPYNTQYRLARYETPSGECLVGKLPGHLNDGHFGPTLRSFIVHQHHHQRVTHPLLLSQLHQWDIDISAGQLSRILTERNETFHQEKDQLLLAGLTSSTYIHVDDTGARHRGKNGYCTHIGNERFAWFTSTERKSRINFLELLRAPNTDYCINDTAFEYFEQQKLSGAIREQLRNAPHCHFPDEPAWLAHLNALGITNALHRRTATEAALLGSLTEHGLPPELVIVSDDAGQFDVLHHALCWVHAERNFQTLLPFNDTHAKQLAWVREQLWDLYADLKGYKLNPNDQAKLDIEAHFDELCRTKTAFQTLNQALKRLRNNKAELLLVLQRPDIPLHNNLSERDIREYVIKRKISGSTRSDNGRRARDTFASLKKTCQKLGIGFWDYLIDRLTLSNRIPPLPEIVAGTASLPP